MMNKTMMMMKTTIPPSSSEVDDADVFSSFSAAVLDDVTEALASVVSPAVSA